MSEPAHGPSYAQLQDRIRELAEMLDIDRSYVRKLMRGGLQVHELYAKFKFDPDSARR